MLIGVAGKESAGGLAVPAMYSTRWRPLTIAWPLTNTGLIGAFAVAALLFAVAFYPFGDQRRTARGYGIYADRIDGGSFVRAPHRLDWFDPVGDLER